MAKVKSLRDKQVESVISMLNLNVTVEETKPDPVVDYVWKVLIYDQFGQEIIAPLLRVRDLRDNGVTMHMLLHSDRQNIPDVPAVYFVEPTAANVQRICDDLAKGLYDNYYINFSSVVSRDLLEMLAQNSYQSSTFSSISQVFDQYLNFLCLETDMFSLNLPNSYMTLNKPSATDSDIETYLKTIVDRLFSVFITTGEIPVIRAPRGNAAESVAQMLETKLRDHVRNARSGDSATGVPQQRPILIVVDRTFDLGTMLHHTWSYQCLAHDVFDMKANRIAFTATEGNRQVKKVFDIDLGDFFWARNASAPFPQMATDVDAELTKYKNEVAEITKSCGVSSLEEISVNDPATSAKSLKAAITALPALAERKRTIDMHMNIASALLKSIKERSLDAFIVLEEAISKQSKATMLEILNAKDKGTPEDKLRSFLLFYLLGDKPPTNAEFAEYENALKQAGCDIAPLRYVQMIKSITKMSAMTNPQATQPSKGGDFLERFSSKIADNLNYSGLGTAMDSLISGVKNILPTKQNLPILRVVSSLADASSGMSSLNIGSSGTSYDDEFMLLDPKASGTSAGKKPLKGPGNKSAYQNVYVFVVGGGNYVEYQNLQEFAKSSGKRITYGSTEICNANSFLQQLSDLGQSSRT